MLNDLDRALAEDELALRLPADRGHPDRRDHRRRGAGALAPSGARDDHARRVHRAGRADGPDRRAGALGPARGRAAWRRVAGAGDRRQRVAAAAERRRASSTTSRARWASSAWWPGRFTIEVTETALMEDPAAAETDAAGAARAGRDDLAGRLRHRLLVAVVGQRLPVVHAEARPRVPGRPPARGPALVDRPRGARHGAHAGARRRRRGRRDRGPARPPRRARRHPRPGLPLRPPAAGRRAVRAAAPRLPINT